MKLKVKKLLKRVYFIFINIVIITQDLLVPINYRNFSYFVKVKMILVGNLLL